MFKSIVKSLALVAILARGVSAAVPPLELAPIADPMTIAQCETITMSWQGGLPPYNIFLLSNATDGSVLKAFPIQYETSIRWKVDLAGGTRFNIQVLGESDDADNVPNAMSDTYNVLYTSDSSCVSTSIVGDPYGETATATAGISDPTASSAIAPSSSSRKLNVVPIVAGLLGGLAGLLLIGLGILFFVRRKHNAAIKKAEMEAALARKVGYGQEEDLESQK